MAGRSFSVPFCYSAEVVTAKKQLVQRTYVEVIEVELHEVGSKPVVLTWSPAPAAGGDRGPGHWRRRGAARVQQAQDRRETVVRIVDGTPVRALDLPDAEGERFAQELLRHLSFQSPAISGAREVKLKGPPRPETVRWTNREDCLRSAMDAVTSVVLIEGKPHGKIPEPLLGASEGAVRVILHEDPGSQWNNFRLDELEDALSRAALLGGVPIDEVVIDEFRLDDTSWLSRSLSDMAVITGARALERTVGEILHDLPVDAMMDFCDLRDVLLERDRSTESIIVPMTALVERMRGIGRGGLVELAGQVLEVEGRRMAVPRDLVA